MPVKTLGWLLGLGVAGMLVAALLNLPPATHPPATVETAVASAPPPSTTAPAATAFRTGLENLPAGLRDVQVDGRLRADAQGHLRVEPALRRVFDFFLSAEGAEPLPTLIARLHAYFNTQLPAIAAQEARMQLAEYLAMLQMLERQDETLPTGRDDQGMNLALLQERKAHIQAIRQQFLRPDTYAAFYAEEEAYDRFALARLAIHQNGQLTASERAAQLAALEQTLPDALRESVQHLSQLEQLTQAAKNNRASAARLHQARETLAGAAAADRLEILDQQRADWDRRLQGWLHERQQLLDNAGLAAADRETQIEALRQTHFSTPEIRRVKALERLATTPAD